MRNRRPPVTAVALAIVSCLAIVALASCSQQPVAPAPTKPPATGVPTAPAGQIGSGKPGQAPSTPPLTSVNRSDPDAVASAAATWALAVDTTLDQRPADAQLRSLQLYTPQAAMQLQAARPLGNVDHDWTTATSHRAWASVSLQAFTADDQPPDTPARTVRAYLTSQQWIGRDGWRAPIDPLRVWVFLTKTSTGYAVTSMNTNTP